MKKKLFLVSSFVDMAELFAEEFSEQYKGKHVTFIPTASIPESYKGYVLHAKEAFEKMGIIVDELEISMASTDQIKHTLQKNELIYVSGGNTFYLLQELRKKQVDRLIVEQVEQGKLYIGESAGSIIAAPSITYIEQMDDRKEATELKNDNGLHLVSFYPVPHLNEEPFKEAADAVIASYNHLLKLVPMTNHEGLLIDTSEM